MHGNYTTHTSTATGSKRKSKGLFEKKSQDKQK